ncbi:MAG: ribosome biogenesis GTPase Der [Gammaproteobacteria bacterium]|nr:ribosome biogenesis GTPase Der [Gammaproteobacteria bacterium]
MQLVFALVGRPNVGKSTLFNAITRTRNALVADFPGLTRDRQYGIGVVGSRDPYLVIDTGGLSGDEHGIDGFMAQQALQAIAEADAVILLVDAREGLTAADEGIARVLRQKGKTIHLVVNKSDGLNPEWVVNDFFALGLGQPMAISASNNRGVRSLMEEVIATSPSTERGEDPVAEDGDRIKVAIIGRPNAGKSTLVNRIMGEDRVVVFDLPGTTRDSIYIPFARDDQNYTLIDTAGVRRRARVKEGIEKFSIIKTLQAIDNANVVVMVLDAHSGISDQDAHLMGFALEAGRAMVIAVNKWDGLTPDQREEIKRMVNLKFPFLSFAKIHFISALHGTGVGHLFASINRAYQSAMIDVPTSLLTRHLEALTLSHQPPLVRGRRIKLRYAHQGGKNPPIIVIHGNQTESLPGSYCRYLENGFRQALQLEGTPVRLELKQSENPYAGRKNHLTPKQVKSRQRLVKFSKKRGR